MTSSKWLGVMIAALVLSTALSVLSGLALLDTQAAQVIVGSADTLPLAAASIGSTLLLNLIVGGLVFVTWRRAQTRVSEIENDADEREQERKQLRLHAIALIDDHLHACQEIHVMETRFDGVESTAWATNLAERRRALVTSTLNVMLQLDLSDAEAEKIMTPYLGVGMADVFEEICMEVRNGHEPGEMFQKLRVQVWFGTLVRMARPAPPEPHKGSVPPPT